MALFIIRKVHEDANFIYASDIRLPSGQKFEITDKDGFPVQRTDDRGNLKLKGTQTKLI